MSTAERCKRYEPNQGQLFPAHLSDGLDPSDPVFFVDDVVEGLDLSAFDQRYSVNGEHAYSAWLRSMAARSGRTPPGTRP